MKKYCLYVDESGDFDKDLENERKNPSLIGGLLWGKDAMPDISSFEHTMEGIFEENNHATDLTPEQKGLLVYRLLTGAKEFPVEFVIFENDVRRKIITSTQTYLTMITEGAVQLLRKLVILEDEPVELQVVAGFKKDTTLPVTPSFTEGYIDPEAYRKRLEEKFAVEKAKAASPDMQKSRISVRLADDKRNTVLVVCDYVCNFRYTNPARAFSVKITRGGEEITVRDALNPLYKEEYIFSLFHTQEDDHVLRMVQDGFYADALFESMSGMLTEGNKRLIWESLKKNTGEEIHRQLTSLTGYIGDLVLSGENDALTKAVLEQADALHLYLQEAGKEDRWFYLNVQLYRLAFLEYTEDDEALDQLFVRLEPMIADYTARTLDMDFMLIYYIRKAVYLLGRSCYEESCRICNNLVKLISMVEDALRSNECIVLEGEPKSDQLGKILGTRLQAEIVLCMLGSTPYEQVRETSDQAMGQFCFASDLHRQYQYRAELEAVAGHYADAIAWMERSFEGKGWKEQLSGPEKNLYDIYNMAYIAAFTCLQNPAANGSLSSEGAEALPAREGAREIARFLYQNCRKELPSVGTIPSLCRLYMATVLLEQKADEDKGKSLLRTVIYGDGSTPDSPAANNRSACKLREVAEHMLSKSGDIRDYFR
ncbi:MAG: hypothetical protein K5682_06405 [Lachnospiraceae bacterium]|nr:hypothetical protein [Lachnospiraceae bacterium]